MLGRLTAQWRRLLVGMALMIALLAAYLLLHGVPDDLQVDAVFAVAIVLTALIVVGGAILILALIAPGSLPVVELFLITIIACLPISYLRHLMGLPA